VLPTTKQLRYFIALDNYRHFGKAAASCFISQSAFSLAIKELENTLHMQLFDRTNKSVMITSDGQAIAAQARVCMREVERLSEMAASGQEPLSGRLTLGVIPTIAPFLLPTFIAESQKHFPKLKLYLREEKTAILHSQLLEGKLDLILVALPFDLNGTTMMPLFKDPFLFTCCRGSQWIDTSKKSLDFDSLPDESVLLLEDGHCLRDHALAACDIRNSDQISCFSATSLQTLLQMVVADLGITFVPAMAEKSLIATHSDLMLYPMSKQSCREICLVWRKGSSRSDEFTLLGKLLQQLHQGHFCAKS